MEGALGRAIERGARRHPDRSVLEDGRGAALSWRELRDRVETGARQLRGTGTRVLGIHCDNGIDWIAADLSAHVARIPTVPLPRFFTDVQLEHVVRSARIDSVVSDAGTSLRDLSFEPSTRLALGEAWILRRSCEAPEHGGFQKVTFTSGTTGAPKGVCLGRDHLETVADTLGQATGSLASDVHLCCLPLSILLENVAGVYRSLLRGGRIVAPPLADVGLVGARAFDPARALSALCACGATSAILVPEMLKGVVASAGGDAGTRLRYIGVGGARVAPALLEAAKAVGLPAYEGYGLSETASVVALNTPGDERIGASGRPLPHLEVRIGEAGEIQVRGPHFEGYLTEAGLAAPLCTPDGFLPTGDRGELDEGGFVRVTGRLRNVIITSFGRNVSPEWVESELLAHPLVAEAVVGGDGEPALSAVITVRADGDWIEDHLAAVNRRLPDYARIERCAVSKVPFAAREGLVTAGGAPRRDAVERHFAALSVDERSQKEQDAWAFTIAS